MAESNCIISELRARRQTLALSAADLAGRSGVDENLLCAWEHGAKLPSLDALQQWAAALGLRVSLAPNGQEPLRGIRADWEKRRITVDDKPVRLTPMEWRVIERLARTPGALVTHQELYRYVYDQDWTSRGQATAVRVLITKLRRLLPLQIEARWGQGYILTGLEPPKRNEPKAERPPTEPPFAQETEETAAAEPKLLDLSGPGAPDVLRRNRSPVRPAALRTGDAVVRHGVVTVGKANTGRAEELGVIERFLAERGVTRCPDLRTIEKSPLPALVWDKVKRKWVRPAAEELRVG